MRAASAPEQIVAELVRVGEPAELAVLYEWLEARPGGTDLGYVLYAYDPDSLAVRHADWVQDRRTFAITPIGTSTLAIAEEKYQHVEYFDVRTRRVTRRVSLPASSASVRYDMTSIAQAPGTGRILTTTPLDLASVRMVDRDEAFGLTMPFERIVFPTSVHPWPADVDVLIVGGVAPDADGTYDAVVMFYDTRHARFLPGTWPIGQGAVTRMLTDRAGRVWALLPWAGEVVRLTPG